MIALVDTNIWVDALIIREPFYFYSKGALLACVNDGVQVKIAATSLKDVFYIIAKCYSVEEAYEAINTILSVASIATVDSLVCTRAFNLERPDYEDGIIAAVAQAERVDCIITRDQKAFRKLDITTYTPEEFVAAQGYQEIEF